MPYYFHLSYDTINCEKHFDDNYDEAKRYLICVLLSVDYYVTLEAFCETSIVITLSHDDSANLYKFLKNNLSKYFNYIITCVEKNFEIPNFDDNRNVQLFDNFKNYIDQISCDRLKYNIKN